MFDPEMNRGMPSLAAAPAGPYTRLPHSREAASIRAFSWAGSRLTRFGWIYGLGGEGCSRPHMAIVIPQPNRRSGQIVFIAKRTETGGA